MSSFQHLTTEIRPDGAALLTLNRPQQRNALSIALREELSACLASWRDDPAVGAVVIRGSGPVFCAGFDLKDFADPARFDDLFASSARYHRDLWHFPKPVIAAIDGPALGGGLDLALLCDLRLASESASFGHPEVKFGAPPLYSLLAWVVGAGPARELCLTGRRIDAAEALRIGLVNEIVSGDGLLDRALALAAEILAAPAATLRFAKEMMNASAGGDFEATFAVEHDRAFREVLLPLMAERGREPG
ncbi:enoyl-CoA hydratase/isomerase [Desulfuromonas sp. DDH964]|uniref:enoyl-CoA hydratase/isomerase family protein n=1 Tax=Desulfuromonas sp. DDH964 TaxID=1823759 RepID=UPI00078B6E4F|nr:enoyl-CoA hydratase/isomerase family protein [Desulfuromonas sp. DDH964]AMV71527.1 enoyl-CoA hydratase/isomerase [Desulfuromonas sp. DDH964]